MDGGENVSGYGSVALMDGPLDSYQFSRVDSEGNVHDEGVYGIGLSDTPGYTWIHPDLYPDTLVDGPQETTNARYDDMILERERERE